MSRAPGIWQRGLSNPCQHLKRAATSTRVSAQWLQRSWRISSLAIISTNRVRQLAYPLYLNLTPPTC
jgi:hypothetical protein